MQTKIDPLRATQPAEMKLRMLLIQETLGAFASLRVGAAGENAEMESFFALLKKDVLSQDPWESRDQLRSAIIYWIERAYQCRRGRAGLGRLTPIDYETIMSTAVESAACKQTVT